jgi:hypothetical protein
MTPEEKIADIKANCDLAIEGRDVNIKELEKENAELKKEILEVRQHLELTEREWGKDTVKLYHFKTQLTKAKEIIKGFARLEYADFTNGDYSNELSKVLKQAEQFLKQE